MSEISRQPGYEDLIREARAAYQDLRLAEALEGFRAAEALQPDSFEVHLGLAQTLTRMRREEEALRAAQKAISLDSGRFEAYTALGVLHFLADRHDEAMAALRHAVELAPNDPEPRLVLAQVDADLRRFTEAEAELGVAHELVGAIKDQRAREQMLALAWHVETYLYLAEGRNTEAVESAQKVISQEGVNPYAATLAYSNLGVLELRQRHYNQAIEYLERAYEKNPYMHRAALTLGRLLIMRNRPQRAAEVLGQTLETMPAPTDGSARFFYAMSLARSGRREEALAAYRQALGEGLKGIDNLGARWQVIWLSTWGRAVVIAIGLGAVLAWILLFKPTPQTLTLVLLLVVILVLRRAIGRRVR
jgi:tetratricopeptide (TPR) repeat protein